MIRTVLRLQPKDKDGQSLVRFYQQELVLERAVSRPGCLGAEIALPRDAEQAVLVTAVWESLAAYQGWVDDPWRQHSAGELSHLLVEDLPGTASGQIYEVAHSVMREAADAPRSTLSAELIPPAAKLPRS